MFNSYGNWIYFLCYIPYRNIFNESIDIYENHGTLKISLILLYILELSCNFLKCVH